MDPGLVLTTRSTGDAEADIAALEERGIEAIGAPMLAIRPLNAELPDPEGFDAVVLTSRHAASTPGIDAFRDLACYCVGEETAAEASRAGFDRVKTGPGDAEGLSALIADDAACRSVFWASGADTAFDLARALGSSRIELVRRAVYAAEPVEDLPGDALDAVRGGRVGVVMVYSGRAGGHFRELLNRNGLGEARSSMALVAISPRVAGLCGNGWHTITHAERPDRQAMVEMVVRTVGRGNDRISQRNGK